MQKDNLKFAFLGTPEVASRTLQLLISAGYKPEVIITSPDAPSGRGLEIKESPVSILAKVHNIPCLKPEKIDGELIEEFKKLGINLSIVVAYGKILPESLIETPELGTINIHYSLLPKYRGASPLESCLLAGDIITGVSIQQMQYKLDSGPIIAEKKINISTDDTKESLRERLINLGAETLVEVLPKVASKEINPLIQNDQEATYCKKIKKEDGKIDIEGDARTNYNKYRAFFGWPGIYFFVQKNPTTSVSKKLRVKITKARYENDSFIIEKVIPEGKKEIDYSNFKYL